MIQKTSVGNLAKISIFDSMASGAGDAGKSTSFNRLMRRGKRVCAKGNTSRIYLSRPI